jgi:hypothetical protein
MENALKLTALLYLSEALENQEFESCAMLVSAAKELGVEQGEIDAAIALYLKGGRSVKSSEAKVQQNRLRVLMEE